MVYIVMARLMGTDDGLSAMSISKKVVSQVHRTEWNGVAKTVYHSYAMLLGGEAYEVSTHSHTCTDEC